MRRQWVFSIKFQKPSEKFIVQNKYPDKYVFMSRLKCERENRILLKKKDRKTENSGFR